MDFLAWSFVLICVSAVYCESIDYRKASEILKTLSPDVVLLESNIFQTRGYLSSPVTRFLNFMRDHDKVYSSVEDLLRRHENFVTNVEKAEDYQSEDSGTAVFGVNKFFDLSDSDLQQLTGLNLDSTLEDIQPSLQAPFSSNQTDTEMRAFQFNTLRHGDDLPEAFDWRAEGVISEVKEQGKCACCWAFSAVGVVEAMHAIQGNSLTELSVQQLVDCDMSNGGCNGGRMDDALQYIIDNGGVVSDQAYPYKASESERGCLVGEEEGFKVKVKEYSRIPYGEEEEMKKWVATRGPLSVGMNANGLFYYSGGVIDLNQRLCNPKAQNHALIIVGYGEEEKKDGTSIPYWIVKNSWGSDWGEKGYFRIRRGADTCGISYFVHGAITEGIGA
ncbi:hypothetical protein M8J77_000365 [Diaphorina citri]|nr:hypothetical protein M8J77_000365 [Diaphorina citri]